MNTTSLNLGDASPTTTATSAPGESATTQGNVWFILLTLTAFVLIASVVTAHHEMWSDELQHWGIAVESRTPVDVFHNLRYESTPALWQLCLYLITRLTHDPVWMQVFHVALATTAAAIFLIWSPFTKLQKALFVFGYFPVYEYAAISRHYVLGELLLFAFLALYPWCGKRAIGAGIALFLLSQTSFFGFVLTFGCATAMLTYYWVYREPDARLLTWTIVIGLVIASVGLATSFLQILQHPDSSVHIGWDFIDPLQALQATTTPWRALVPLPKVQLEFWNTNILDSASAFHDGRDLLSLFTQAVLATILVGGSTAYLWRRPEALVLFLVVVLACGAFFYTKKLGYLRHHGHLYLAWVGAVWVAWSPHSNHVGANASRTVSRCVPIGIRWAVTAVFSLHAVAASYACGMDYQFSFSAAKDVAAWIDKQGHVDDLLIAPVAVGGYLDRDVYITHNDRFGRFDFYRHGPFYMRAELVTLAYRLEREHHKPVLLVLGIGDDTYLNRHMVKLFSFTETIGFGARYEIYKLRQHPKSDVLSDKPTNAAYPSLLP